MGDEVRCTVIATGFEHSRVQRKIDAQPTGPFRSTAGSGSTSTSSSRPGMSSQPQTQRPAPQYQQYSAPPAPQQQPMQPPPQEQPPTPPAPPPVQPPRQEPSARVYDDENIEIPAFLRKPKR